MNTHYSNAVRSEHASDSPRELLESELTVLVGVDEETKQALESIGIETVQDLATSATFETVRAVHETVSTGGPSGNTDRTTAQAAANEQTDGDVAALAAADIDALAGIDESDAETIGDALGVSTVRDLAHWPPYEGARSVLGALTGEESDTHEGVPSELVPTARKYATESTYYSQIYIDRKLVGQDPEGPEDGDMGDYMPGEYGEIPPDSLDTYNMPTVVSETALEDIERGRLVGDIASIGSSLGRGVLTGDGDGGFARTIVIASGEGQGKSRYTIKVSGDLRAVDDETIPPGIEVTANEADEVTESEAVGTVATGADGFRFEGELVDLSLSDPSAVDVYVDGTLWRDGAPLTRTLVVDSRDVTGATEWNLEVSGRLEPVDDETLPPGIRVTWTESGERTRDTASGRVSTGADGVRFSGEVESFDIADHEDAEVYLDGDRIEYPSTLGNTEISLSGSGRIDVEGDDEREGFSDPAVGGILQFSQKWVPQGLSLGQLLHSTTLAPGESTKVAVVDWSRRTRGERTESESQRERTEAGMTQNRSISEVQNGVATEIQRGSSTVSTVSETHQFGSTSQGGFNIGIASSGGSSSSSSSRTETTTSSVKSSMGRREVHSDMSQKIRNATQQHASSSRTRRATVVRETEQEESEEVRTRVVTNHNHMHALSVHYYEVVQVFRVEVAPEQAKPVMFVPFERLDFSNEDLIFKHRQALRDAALDRTTRELLDDATGYRTVVPEFELAADSASYDLDSELGSIGAELRSEGVLAIPRENLLESISVDGPEVDLTIHRRDGAAPVRVTARDAISRQGSTVYPVDEFVAVSDVDHVNATLTQGGAEAADLGRTLVVDSRDVDGATEYAVRVSGSIELVDDESLHGIDVTNDARDSAGEHTATGRVSSGADGMRFSGDIERIELDDPDAADVIVDGEPFSDDSELDRSLSISFVSPIGGMPVGVIPYTVEVSGGIIESDAAPTDSDASGRTVTGQLTPANNEVEYDFAGRVENIYVGTPPLTKVTVDGNRITQPNNYTEQGRDDDAFEPDPIDVGLEVALSRPDGSETGTVSGRTRLQPGAETMRVLDVVGNRNLPRLIRRLNEEQLHYSQAVWTSMDAPRIAMLLEDYDMNGRSAADFVEPVPEATHGNLVAFPLALPESVEKADDRRMARLASWWDEWRGENYEGATIDRDLVPLPSGGVHGEAVLGRANSAEKLDITRFWDWQESPIPQEAPQVDPIQTGSRAASEDLSPSGFDQPIVQMQQPQNLPDPTGVGAVLDTLGQSGMFRDMSGIDAAAQLGQAAQEASGQAASDAASTAADVYKTGAKTRVQQTKTIADLIKSLNSDGETNAQNANSSDTGAMINEADKRTQNGAAGGGSSGSGGSNGSGGGSGSGGGGGSGGNGVSPSGSAPGGSDDLATKLVKAYATGSGEPLLSGGAGAAGGYEAAAGAAGAGLVGSADSGSAQPELDSQAGREFEMARKGIGEWTWRARKLWTLVQRAKTMRYPDEPETNVDWLPIPPWIDAQQWKGKIEDQYDREHQELLNENPGTNMTREPSNVIGDFSQGVDAEYFVVHDPAVAPGNYVPSQTNTGDDYVHLFLGPDSIEMKYDWHQSANGVKLEQDDPSTSQVDSLAPCFLHTEVSRAPPDRRDSDTGLYTFRQYYDLANAYVAASLRAGQFLTVTGHVEVDRSFQNGHEDPVDFNVDLLYDMISSSLALGDTGPADGLGLDPTFGIANDRLNTDNNAGEINEFAPYAAGSIPKADQYGEIRTAPNYRSYDVRHDSGNHYTEAGTAAHGFQCGGGDWPDHAESPPIPEAARSYVDEA